MTGNILFGLQFTLLLFNLIVSVSESLISYNLICVLFDLLDALLSILFALFNAETKLLQHPISFCRKAKTLAICGVASFNPYTVVTSTALLFRQTLLADGGTTF